MVIPLKKTCFPITLVKSSLLIAFILAKINHTITLRDDSQVLQVG